ALPGAADQIDFIALTRLRCRACHTVETLFPPGILPYELAALFFRGGGDRGGSRRAFLPAHR
ncbi:MAG: hypothetical protein M0Z53_13745, partial [Thermaerobacter sp.]|nr:hypothetical protein [Thermaerobacter sp.]